MNNPHKETIIAMRKAGKWPTEIARELKISRNAVIGICNRAGLASAEADKSIMQRKYVLRGSAVPHSKLTDSDVRYLRAVYIPRHREFGGAALAREYGVFQSTLQNALTGKTWAHVQ